MVIGELKDLSCIGRTFCMAVGDYAVDENGNVPGTLAETWNGTSWQFPAFPRPPGPQSVLTAVSCVTPVACMAVGNYINAKDVELNFAAEWSGQAWRLLRMPGSFDPGPPVSNETATGAVDVSCPTAASCMAVGSDYDPATGAFENLATVWNGKTWRLVNTVGLSGQLADVSCTVPGQCIAVGQAGTKTLAERWNGKTWQRLKTFNP